MTSYQQQQNTSRLHKTFQTSPLSTMTLRAGSSHMRQENTAVSPSISGDASQTTGNQYLRSARNSAVAGYTAGFVGVVLGHPLDSLKVWAQTSSSGRNKHFSASPAMAASNNSIGNSSTVLRRVAPRTIGTASMSTLARSAVTSLAIPTSFSPSSSFEPTKLVRTIRALYSGASCPLITVGIVQSINFSTYDAMRRFLHHRETPNAPQGDYLHNDSLWNVAVAGFVAGTGLAFITSPLIRVKTQQQITGNGFRQALRETLFRPSGKLNLSGCFVGIYPHLLSETLGRAMYYCVYEACKRQTASYKAEQGLSPTVSLGERMSAAAFAGICCWSAIFPLDALRNRLYSQAATATGQGKPLLSTLEMARAMYHEGALYRGFSMTILRAGPVAAAVLPVYDLVLEQLSSD